MRIIIITAITLAAMILNSPVFAQEQPVDENCRFQIWAAGSNLGWSTSLMYYTREREQWLEGPDSTITNNLLRAGRHIQQANQRCNQGPTQAWPAWSQKKYTLKQITDSLANNPSSRNRNELSKHLWSTQNWSIPLRVIDTGAQIINDGTCAEKYFRMGWWTGYIQQTLHIAGEALKDGNPAWKDMVHHAKNHMGSLLNTVFEYQNLKPITGHCACIDTQDLIKRISDIQSRDFSSQSLNYMTGGFDWLQPEIQQRIIDDCPGRNAPTLPTYGQEICGDGMDNDGDQEIDEGCYAENKIILDDSKCPDDTMALVIDGVDYGTNPPGHKRHYNIGYIDPNRKHKLEIIGIKSGGSQYRKRGGSGRCADTKEITYKVNIDKKLRFKHNNRNNVRTGTIMEGKKAMFWFEVR
jgi:hypothetical protein